MKADDQPPRRMTGNATVFPVQGAAKSTSDPEGRILRQSCLPSPSGGGSEPVRLRLAKRHAARWRALPRNVRMHAADVLFGSWIEGIEITDLVAIAGELRLARAAVSQALKLGRAKAVKVDEGQLLLAINKINRLLGGRHT